MRTIELQCEVITPLFMGGADMEPEIRTQSIKGVMRWWWRALKSYYDTKKLLQEEVDIFGGYKKEENQHKAYSSKVILVLDEAIEKGTNIKDDFGLVWHFDSKKRCLKDKDEGIGYLLYSVLKREYVNPNSSKFKLFLRSRDDNALKNALASLWCAFYLGNFGSRARRGAGSIIVENIKSDENGKKIVNETGLDFLIDTKDKHVVEWYEENIKKCFKIVGVDKLNGDNCRYSNLFNAEIFISQKPFRDWREALRDIGGLYSKFRYEHRSEILDTAIFGLPVVHRAGKVLAVSNTKKDKTQKIHRRASPLIFKIVRYNKEYYWVVVKLGGSYLPQGAKIAFFKKTEREEKKKKDELTESKQPNFNLLNEFIEMLKKQSHIIECWRLI